MKKSKIVFLLIVLGVAAIIATPRHFASAYATAGNHWPVNSVNYYVNPTNSQGLDATAIHNNAAAAAAAWPTQTGINLTLRDAGNTNASVVALDNQNNIFFRNDGSNGYLMATYTWWYTATRQLIEADTVINEYYNQLTSALRCSGPSFYIQNVLTHEFGHFIGMDHSSVTTATMYPTSGACGTSLESLDPDDIAGVLTLYPISTATSHINLSPTSLNFSANSGTAPAAQSVTLSNSGTATLNWVGSTNQSWCHVSPTSGSLAVGTNSTLFVSVNAQNYGGSFSCTVAISDSNANNSPQYVNVGYTVVGVVDMALPTIAITSPANGAQVSNGKVTIQALAADASGIAKVEFYIDNALKATDASSPYSYNWNVNKSVSAGTHTITVRAYDNVSPANMAAATITVTK